MDSKEPTLWDLSSIALTEDRPISVGDTTHTTATGPDFDMHYFLEIGIALMGRIRRHWPSWETVLDAGDVWYCGVLEPHGWETVDVPCHHLVVTLLPSALLPTGLPVDPASDLLAPFRSPPERRPRIQPTDRQHVLAIAHDIAALGGLRLQEQRIRLRLLVLELLLLVQKDWDSSESFDASSLASPVGRAVDLVLRAHGPVSVGQAAKEATMSRRTFQRAFRSLVGMSFGKYSRRHRLAQAARQLWRTDDSIGAVASAWGFADASHFSRLFQQYYRCSPRHYRHRQRPSLTWPTRSEEHGTARSDTASASPRSGD